MASYNDNLTFNEAGLARTISDVKELKATCDKVKEEFIDYIETTLKPNWTTEGGVRAIDSINKFVNGDIQHFIDFIQQKIYDLENAARNVSNINNS